MLSIPREIQVLQSEVKKLLAELVVANATIETQALELEEWEIVKDALRTLYTVSNALGVGDPPSVEQWDARLRLIRKQKEGG